MASKKLRQQAHLPACLYLFKTQCTWFVILDLSVMKADVGVLCCHQQHAGMYGYPAYVACLMTART
jgi:hypothetical protein